MLNRLYARYRAFQMKRYANQLHQEMIQCHLTTANLIEEVLVSGRYMEDGGANRYMCLLLDDFHGQCTPGLGVAKQRIMNQLKDCVALVTHLRNTGDLDEDADDFEIRIVCSNWYWALIRKHRKIAAKLEKHFNTQKESPCAA